MTQQSHSRHISGEDKNSNSEKYMHLYSVHSSTIYNCQDRTQATYLLTEEWIKKIWCVCVCVCVCVYKKHNITHT